MSDEREAGRPSFSAPLWAALRQGADEVAQVLPAFPDSVRCVDEPGTLGSPTQAMVTEQIGSLNGYDHVLDAYASQGREEVGREVEMER